MFAFYKSRNVDDFRQRYLHSYGWIHEIATNKKKLVVVLVVEYDYIIVGLVHEGGKKVTINVDDPRYNFTFVPVSRGWYNANADGPLFLCRKPARQWSRGMHANNTTVYSHQLFPTKLTRELVASILWDEWRYTKGVPSAISPQFMISTHTVFFYDNPIGKVNDDLSLSLNDNLVSQELQDIVRRKGYLINIRT